MKRYYDWESFADSMYDRLDSIRAVLIDIGSRIEALERILAPKAHDTPDIWSGEVYSHYREFCNDEERRLRK